MLGQWSHLGDLEGLTYFRPRIVQMSTLSTDQLAELREILEKELKALQRSMKVSADALKPVELDQTAVGRLSRMDSLQNQSMTRNLHEREQVKLAKIETALHRLEQGSYGTCISCGAPVPYGRLLVFPETESCAVCE